MTFVFFGEFMKTELLQKEENPFLTLQAAADYLNCSTSFLYKLTSKNLITHFKPNGKKLYFKKVDLNNFILKSEIRGKKNNG